MTEKEWNERAIDLIQAVDLLAMENAAGVAIDLDGRLEKLGQEADELIYAVGNFAKCDKCHRPMNDCGCYLPQSPPRPRPPSDIPF